MDAPNIGSSSSKYSINDPEAKGYKRSRKEFCCGQLLGVVLFCLGLLAGLLIGIYAYHGGPNGEVNCKIDSLTSVSEQTTKETPTTTTDPPMPSETTTKGPMTSEASTRDPGQCDPTADDMPSDCKWCNKREPRQPWDGEDEELFAPLTAEEMQKAFDFLVEQGIVYNRPADEEVSLKTNYAPYMYLNLPVKQAVMDYYAGTGPYPGRYAEVHVARGNRTVPDYMQYKVGPMNGNGPMTAMQMFQDNELVYNSRPYDYVETAVYEKLVIPDFQLLEPLTKESFDGAYYPGGDLSFWFFNGPPGDKADERETRFLVFFNPYNNGYDITELDFLPLTGTIHCPGNDLSTWYIYDYYYLNQGPFSNAQALLDAYMAGTIRKVALPNGYRSTVKERSFVDRDNDKPFRKNARMPPPRTYEPDGPRYSIKGHHVEWMGWSFHVTSGQLRGPGLYKIMFKEQSIAYELALNDIGLIYGSDASAQTNVVYTDSSYGIGEYYGVVATVDCPEHATLLETSHWDVYISEPVVHKSICVYEADGENALWRHKGMDFEGGLRNNYLVVRLSATIDNYDYIVEWHFYLDGKIYTIVSASGYIQGAFWDSENPNMGSDKSRDAFGFRVSDYTHGQMHDHMFGFKVDMDVLGTENTMETIHWKVGDVLTAMKSQKSNANSVPPYFLNNITRYLEYEYIERETGLKVDLNEPAFWLVTNENYRNKWGAERAYQIMPLTTSSQIMTDAHPSMPALSFTKYHCAVSLRKEEEPSITSTSDINRFDKPIGDVESKLNNEYIRGKDIVTWVSVGFMHLPTAEDVPMTNRVESGFMLKPFNFFDKTDVFDMPAFLDTKDCLHTERPPRYQPCLEKKAMLKQCNNC